MKILLLLLFLLIGCAKEPLDMTLTVENTTIQIHSSLEFECQATGGKLPYFYTWNIENCINQTKCSKTFKELGTHKVNCMVQDKKTAINKSLSIEVIKIPKKIDHIIGIGDSLTYGKDVSKSWISLYSEDFSGELHNYAVNGATSYSAEAYQYPLFEEDSLEGSKLVFIWFGANDIKNFHSLEEFKTNYISILDKITSIPDTDVILITIPDVSELSVVEDIEVEINSLLSNFGVQIPIREIGQDVIISYNKAVFSFASNYNLNVIDMFSYMQKFDESLIGWDRFHPNEEGHEEIKKVIEEEVESFYEDYELI